LSAELNCVVGVGVVVTVFARVTVLRCCGVAPPLQLIGRTKELQDVTLVMQTCQKNLSLKKRSCEQYAAIIDTLQESQRADVETAFICSKYKASRQRLDADADASGPVAVPVPVPVLAPAPTSTPTPTPTPAKRQHKPHARKHSRHGRHGHGHGHGHGPRDTETDADALSITSGSAM